MSQQPLDANLALVPKVLRCLNIICRRLLNVWEVADERYTTIGRAVPPLHSGWKEYINEARADNTTKINHRKWQAYVINEIIARVDELEKKENLVVARLADVLEVMKDFRKNFAKFLFKDCLVLVSEEPVRMRDIHGSTYLVPRDKVKEGRKRLLETSDRILREIIIGVQLLPWFEEGSRAAHWQWFGPVIQWLYNLETTYYEKPEQVGEDADTFFQNIWVDRKSKTPEMQETPATQEKGYWEKRLEKEKKRLFWFLDEEISEVEAGPSSKMQKQ